MLLKTIFVAWSIWCVCLLVALVFFLYYRWDEEKVAKIESIIDKLTIVVVMVTNLSLLALIINFCIKNY